jgi:hypothetical protein
LKRLGRRGCECLMAGATTGDETEAPSLYGRLLLDPRRYTAFVRLAAKGKHWNPHQINSTHMS